MAKSNCVRCEGTTFELKPIEPRASNFTFYAIQCTDCGGVAGITDYVNNGAMLEKIWKRITGK